MTTYTEIVSSRVADTDVSASEMNDIVSIVSGADEEIARLQALVGELAKELGEVLDWHKFETIQLRKQELDSIRRVIAKVGR